MPYLHAAERVQREADAREDSVTVRRDAAAAPTMTVGAVHDPAEMAADRVADEVLGRLRALDPGESSLHDDVHRSASPGGGGDAVVGAAGGALPEGIADQIGRKAGGGAPLPMATRSRMEGAFGTSLGSVRIHDDAESARLNRMVSARAFTLGKDIFFGAGEYRPGHPEGDRVLAHELAHTQQSGGVRRISRLWDLKSRKDLPIGAAREVRTLRSRAIWFARDASQDEIVIKPEDQPTGLSDLVAGMHKKITNVRSVKQRKLTRSEIYSLDNMIEVNAFPGVEPSWGDRGSFLDANPTEQAVQPAQSIADEEPSTIAKDDALARLHKRGVNIIAMTLAEGEDAMAAAAPDTTADQTSAAVSRMRQLLEDSNHVRKLGQMNMVDLFMGNQDRLMSGNLGNWFYNPDNVITLIDHVDPGDNQGGEMTGGMVDYQTWYDRTGVQWLRNAAKRKEAASEAKTRIMYRMEDDEMGAGDSTVVDWFKTVVDGKKRADRITDDLFAGMEETKAKIVKIFGAKKFSLMRPSSWSKSNRRARSTQKSLRGKANAASAADTGDERYDQGQQLDYYSMLQQRATFLAGA